MDIEQLSKSQIVLLTLLISFVTSIATGIVTVSLVDQAPPAIAETVNRVIERTIQQATSTQVAATVVTQQKTVVVKESDLIAQAVAAVAPSMVRIYTPDATSPTFLGLGVVLDQNGTMATDDGALGDNIELSAALADGTIVRVFVTKRDAASGLVYLTPATSTAAKAVAWKPAKLLTTDPELGESVVTLAGESVARIGNGLISSVTDGSAKSPAIFDTSIPDAAIMKGSVLFDTDGNVVGVSTSVARTSSSSGFVSVSAITKAPPVNSPTATGS